VELLSSKIGMNVSMTEAFQFLNNLNWPEAFALGVRSSRAFIQGLYFLVSFFPSFLP